MLQRLVTQLVVSDGRNDKGCRFRGSVLLAIDDDARRRSPTRALACDARALGSSSRRKRSCGQVVGMLFQKIATAANRVSPDACHRAPRSKKVELGAVEGIAVDLAVIQLDGADGLVGGEASKAGCTKVPIAAMLLVRWSHGVIVEGETPRLVFFLRRVAVSSSV